MGRGKGLPAVSVDQHIALGQIADGRIDAHHGAAFEQRAPARCWLLCLRARERKGRAGEAAGQKRGRAGAQQVSPRHVQSRCALRERSGRQLAAVARPFGDEYLTLATAASDQRRRELGAIACHVQPATGSGDRIDDDRNARRCQGVRSTLV